ncbi:MAG: glycosyltransferase family 8 protein [Clostridia bacterium]|nr:glycosyltransferase family 8 protein [Clostridia bacterium]
MNVVYYSSDFFSEMCGVAIESLCESNTDADNITVYVVEDHISDVNKSRLREITDKFNRELIFIKMPTQEEVYPGVKMNLGRTYARMALGEILPESVDRVLSLDSDTLIMDSISEMYNTQFSDNEYVAGVYDCVGRAIQDKVLHGPKDLKYCNAGMYLIDLKKWRELNVGKQLLDLVLKNADGKHIMYFLEQDLMNMAFYGHLKLLHPRYNMLTSIYLFDYRDVMKMKKPVSYYTEQQIAEAKEKPAIVHATTCFYVKKRMWVENSDHPYFSFYNDYRSRTPWKNDPMVKDSRKKSKKIYAQFWHCMPKKCAIWLASLTINYVRPFYAWATTKASITTVAEQSAT